MFPNISLLFFFQVYKVGFFFFFFLIEKKKKKKKKNFSRMKGMWIRTSLQGSSHS
jgi:hypothetical protein